LRVSVLTTNASGGRGDERSLMKLFRSLGAADRRTLISFAEFLSARVEERPPEPQGPVQPESIARPDKETVVGAIKRLSRSYHMLDRSAMLNETSSLMGAHVLQGRPAAEVIDELEELFVRYYAKYLDELGRGRPHEKER
jgi:hypothetical protein